MRQEVSDALDRLLLSDNPDKNDDGELLKTEIESMQARIELLEKENERLRGDNIRVRGVLQVLNPEALAIADAALKEQT